MPGTAAQMMAYHARPGAFKALTPPPVFLQVLKDEGTSLTQRSIEFRMWFGFIPLLWRVRHEPGPIPTSFIDRSLEGPMAAWEHQHIFRDVPQGVELTDHITFEHKSGLMGLFTRLFFDGLPLRFLFFYRHNVTRRGMKNL